MKQLLLKLNNSFLESDSKKDKESIKVQASVEKKDKPSQKDKTVEEVPSITPKTVNLINSVAETKTCNSFQIPFKSENIGQRRKISDLQVSSVIFVSNYFCFVGHRVYMI